MAATNGFQDPAKRRKLNNGDSQKAWDSQEDSGDEYDPADFESIATVPLESQKRKQLQYGAGQLRNDLNTIQYSATTQTPAAITQPSHVRYTTQPTQPLPPKSPPSYVQVERSSPAPIESTSPARPLPAPIRRAPFAKPVSSMAPPGTMFRPPPNISRPSTLPPPQSNTQDFPIHLSDDDEDDAPVLRSDDEETQTQSLTSNIRPTQFKKGGRGLDSSPNVHLHRVQESPRNVNHNSSVAAPVSGANPFAALVSKFQHGSAASGTGGGDMASAYGGVVRTGSRPGSAVTGKGEKRGASDVRYHKLDDLEDLNIREKVARVREVMSHRSVQDCFDALKWKKWHVEDAKLWLAEQEEAELEKDELDFSPVRKGLARSSTQAAREMEEALPLKQTAKQQVHAPLKTIAEKYAAKRASQVAAAEVQNLDDDDDEDDDVVEVQPVQSRRRLQQGRRPRVASSSPQPNNVSQGSRQTEAQPMSKAKKAVVVLDDDDDDSDSELGRGRSETPAGPTRVEEGRNRKLLQYFNEWSVKDLAELCGRPDDMIEYIVERRPYNTIEDVRAVSIPKTTKRGKPKPIGEMVVDECINMLSGYDAVDVLVEHCEKLAKPVQKALRSWGVGDSDGELHLMKLDENHDSGIGTPSSTCPSDDVPLKKKSSFLGQPTNMSKDLVMKDYQLVGLNWLNLLFDKQISCILADDMGLGKTCQIIAFLSYLKLQKVDGVHLVVVPASTLENWLRELDRFSPDLVVQPYYGLQAERFQLQEYIEAEFHNIDVIVTTYDMVVGKEDNKFFRNTGPFSVCVYDEGHVLRNPNSKRYSQLVKIEADFKVILSGTPLQNNLQELIAILAFIMPDIFQHQRDELENIFKHKATTKDAASVALLSAERINRARTMMTPFILRRKKEQVLDLPKKIKRFEICEMGKMQTAHYADVLDNARSFYAEKAAGNKTNAKASSNVIMSLRKAAIHPLLSRRLYTDRKIEQMVSAMKKAGELGGNEEHIRQYLLGEHHQSEGSGDYFLHKLCLVYPPIKKFALKNEEWMDAAKVDVLRDLVTEYISNGDRVLIFSQFTMAMDILESVFETLNIKFMRLDGTTQVNLRQEMIDKFTNDTSIPVFMLSTKAGGAGINLACANKVIIFDSGFNPQDEVQAENRAHRVGQTREVEVVRMITKGTIEEQIKALGESKLAMGEGVAGGEGATEAEGKQLEKVGEQLVERMLLDGVTKRETDGSEKVNAKEEVKKEDAQSGMDLKDAFKMGMEGKGVKVASKQARF